MDYADVKDCAYCLRVKKVGEDGIGTVGDLSGSFLANEVASPSFLGRLNKGLNGMEGSGGIESRR